MNDITQTNYDYTQLPAETAQLAAGEAATIKEKLANMAEQMVDIGQRLIQVKEVLPHGTWGDWLAQEFQWSQRTANRFMAVAERFAKFDSVSNFAQGALYLLSGDDVPDEAREEAVKRAAGEHVSKRVAQEIAAKYTDDYLKANGWSVTEEDNHLLAEKCDGRVFFIIKGNELSVLRVIAQQLDSQVKYCGEIPIGTRIWKDLNSPTIYLTLDDIQTMPYVHLSKAVEELNNIMQSADENEDIESVFPHKDSEHQQGLTESEQHLLDNYTVVKDTNGYTAFAFEGTIRIHDNTIADLANRVQLFEATGFQVNWLPAFWWVDISINEITARSNTHIRSRIIDDFSETLKACCNDAQQAQREIDNPSQRFGQAEQEPEEKQSQGLICSKCGKHATALIGSQAGDTGLCDACYIESRKTTNKNETESPFAPGELILCNTKDGEYVGEVTQSFYHYHGRVPVIIPYGGEASTQYIEEEKCRKATEHEIAEEQARGELERLSEQEYGFSCMFYHKKVLTSTQKLIINLWKHSGFGTRLEYKTYQDALSYAKKDIADEKQKGQKIATKATELTGDQCTFVGWFDGDGRINDRAFYRLDGNLWSFQQLKRLMKALDTEEELQKIKMEAIKQDARIQELEALLAAAEAELQRMEMAA
jgi:hypothetical protein